MAKQLVPNTAQFRIIQRFIPAVGAPVDFMNTCYVRNTVTPWTVAHLQLTAQAIEVAFTQFDDQQVDEVTRIEIQCEDLGADPGNQHVEPMSSAGTDTNDALPLSVCAVIQLRGQTGNDPGRGRWFLSGLGEGGVSGNELTAEKRAAIDSDASSFFGSTLQPGDAFVLVSRFKDKVKRALGVTNVIEPGALSVRALVGSQRDRRT